jgi:hypothetical protein
MPGDVGLVAKVVDTVFKFFTSEDGYAEFSKRRKLAALRKDANNALDRNDFVAHARIIDELRRVSNEA